MSKKQLIVAADVRRVAKAGDKLIRLHDKTALVTAEARSLARELGVELRQDDGAAACATSPGSQTEQDTVRQLIEAQTHGPASAAMMSEVLRRIGQARAQPATAADSAPEPLATPIRNITSLCPSPQTSRSAVNMSQLDLATLGLTAAAPCTAGFMGWSNNMFPFSRDNDEINLVLEGELQFHVGQAIISARPGDLMWVPKGTQGKIGTPTSVRYFYLGYPL